MKEKDQMDEKFFRNFETIQTDYQKWAPIFSRLGLKPRRYFKDNQAVYTCTVEGWFKLSVVKYEKQELQWLKNILNYLEERSFNNWAVPWQKTIIWEENNFCHLIQPWDFSKTGFIPNDPAAICRIAEVLADFYRCGKDYRENKGIEIFRDRWSAIDLEWEANLKFLENLKEDNYYEKIRKEVHLLKKDTISLLTDCLSIWKSGINNLFDHHLSSGVISHGNLLTKSIIWKENDFFLLDWENLSFQPKIADLASLINDIGIWEPEWIIYFINEYSKIQPFWPEEYQALKAMLQYPSDIMKVFKEDEPGEVEYKMIKEVNKEMKRKNRCLEKVWRELGNDRRWSKGRGGIEKSNENGKISMVLSPIETWGGFEAGQQDSLIYVKTEQKLPNDIYERLVNQTQDRVFGGGREGNIMEAAADHPKNYDYLEIVEEQPTQPDEMMELIKTEPEIEPEKSPQPVIEKKETLQIIQNKSESAETPKKPSVISWGSFPKPLKKEREKVGR